MYNIGYCKICKQGLLEIAKDKLTKKIFICCDECEAEWDNPEDALKGINGTRNKHGEIEYPNTEDILREKWHVLRKVNPALTYEYGAYGEDLSGDIKITPFLYNGQLGIMTDDNDLYYMRAKYYNVNIKRFINQDVVHGSINSVERQLKLWRIRNGC